MILMGGQIVNQNLVQRGVVRALQRQLVSERLNQHGVLIAAYRNKIIGAKFVCGDGVKLLPVLRGRSDAASGLAPGSNT